MLSGLFSRGPVAAQTSDVALLQAMLDVEVALMRALAGAGIAPARRRTRSPSCRCAAFDMAAIGRGSAD